MSPDDPSIREVLNAVSEGLSGEQATFGSSVKEALSGNSLSAAREISGFLKRLVSEETPEDPDEIKQLSKDEIVMTIYRINLFEKLRHPVVDDEQLELLYQRTVEFWGEAPTEPVGRWAEWTLWVTRHRRQNGIDVTEVIEGNQTVEDIKEQWRERHQEREKRRKLHKMQNYDQYELPEDVPSSLRHVLLSPFFNTDATSSEVETLQPESMNGDPVDPVDESL